MERLAITLAGDPASQLPLAGTACIDTTIAVITFSCHTLSPVTIEEVNFCILRIPTTTKVRFHRRSCRSQGALLVGETDFIMRYFTLFVILICSELGKSS